MTKQIPGPAAQALIDAGKCPGWGRSGRYSADVSAYRTCGKRATRGDLCGVHDNVRAHQREKEKLRAAGRLREKERVERVGYATNVAMMLGESLGVALSPNHQGTELSMSVANAERLLES